MLLGGRCKRWFKHEGNTENKEDKEEASTGGHSGAEQPEEKQ